MKTSIKTLALLVAAAGFSACQDDFDNPTIAEPKATLTPNMTILELKQQYWDDATNYIDTIGIENGQDDGKQYVIAGRVISSDEAGNVFKSLVIQDQSAALALSINSYNLYLNYRVGQEIVIDLKGMYIGKYNGLLQLGMPEWYESGNAWEATFMAPEFFREHIEINGFPKPELVDTIEVNSFSELVTNPDGLMKWQSQLVRLNNVSFQNGGVDQFSEYHSSGVNQNIIDASGNTLPVRTSGYSNFWNNYLPTGSGDLVCILSYYGTTGWQLLLNDYEGCMNFGSPTIGPGAQDNPYSVNGAIGTIDNGTPGRGWVTGYIVGAVAPEVMEVKSNDDIEWSAEPILNNTLVIGQAPDTKDIGNCLVISLPDGTDLRKYCNLPDHKDNYQKQIWVKGSFGTYMGTYGVLDNKGTANEFKLEGLEIDLDGKGTIDEPYSIAKAIEVAQANGQSSDVFYYVKGYVISGSIDTSYGNATFDLGDTPSSAERTLKAYRIKDENNQKFTDANKVKVGDQIVIYAPLINYMGNTPETGTGGYLISVNSSGETPNPPTPGDAGTEENPYTVANVLGGASGTDVWVKGYIVGWVDGQVLASGAQFNSNASVKTNLLIADAANVTDVAQCVPVQLPSGSVREALNLQDHPGNYQKEVMLKGNLERYFGTAGVKGVTDYKIDGQSSGGETPGNPGTPAGDGTVEAPYNVARALEVAQANGQESDVSVYTEGYVTSANISLQYGNADFTINDNADGSGPSIKVFRTKDLGNEAFTDANKVKVGDKIVVYAPVINYMGNTPETSYGYLYSINGQTQGNQGGDEPGPGPGTDPGNDDPVNATSADFNTLNGGVANANAYGTYTTADGWVANWALVLAGGTDATNFVSTDASFLFPCIDGTPARPGTLTSPLLSGGIKTLTFKYGCPYNETKIGFTVNILKGGEVVATDTVTLDSVTKGTVYTYSHDFNVSGEYVIEFVNDCVTQSTSNNKDRIALWDLSWTK